MKTFDPRIVWRDPATLTPYSNNAKTHPTEQIDKIAASIAAFGFDQPIVVDTDGVIIKGMAGARPASGWGWTRCRCWSGTTSRWPRSRRHVWRTTERRGAPGMRTCCGSSSKP